MSLGLLWRADTHTPSTRQGGHQRGNGENPGKGHHSGDAAAGVDSLVPMRIGNHHESF